MRATSRKVVESVTMELNCLDADFLYDAAKFLMGRGSAERRAWASNLRAVLEQAGVLDHGMDECIPDFFKEGPLAEG